MKKVIGVLAGCLSAVAVFGQAKPLHTQYVLNNFIINPAIAGVENYTDVKASYRNQWTGIEGNPTTSYITVHAPINKGDLRTNITSVEIPGENPRGKGYWKDYEVSPRHVGVGFTAINDRAGYINRWTVNGNIAVHVPLTPNTAISGGFSAGLTSVNLDRSKIVWGNLDPNDPAVGYNNGELQRVRPELGAGLWLYSKNYFAGVSVLNIVPGKAKFTAAGEQYGTYYTPNYFLTAGVRTFLNDEVSLLPSVMLQYWQPQLTSLHVNVKAQYLDKFWVGASYRNASLVGGFSAMAGFLASNTVNVSYAYEHGVNSRLNTYTKGTHEIMVGFILGNKYGDSCPRNLW
jgi:type IX secretion system PorP/SprF family membrane protein